jgi:hypothetical protein
LYMYNIILLYIYYKMINEKVGVPDCKTKTHQTRNAW